MAGIDKMKKQILEEAKAAAEAKIEEATAKAEEIIDQAKEEAARTCESISRKSEAEVANYRERVVSSTDLQRRTKVLAAKQELISEILDKSYESLARMEADKYFDMMLKLLDAANADIVCFAHNTIRQRSAPQEIVDGVYAAGKMLLSAIVNRAILRIHPRLPHGG